jgi:hypothetical protein
VIIDSLQRHSIIIFNYEVLKFNLVGESYQLVCQIALTDGSILHVRDYLFLDGVRKYSFHWQTASGECIIRWDNAPHHQTVETFPFHAHYGKDERVEPSPPMNLDKVLNYIEHQIFSTDHRN